MVTKKERKKQLARVIRAAKARIADPTNPCKGVKIFVMEDLLEDDEDTTEGQNPALKK